MKQHKFSSLVGGSEWVPHRYGNSWDIEQTTGPQRLVIGPSDNYVDLLIKLTRVLPEPFGILYVLLVSRRENRPARYQCPYPCSRSEMESFLLEFKEYFESDGRHHVWVTSLPQSSTLVYDQHNVIYAYGPLEEFTKILQENGLQRGTVDFPVPHSHNYNPENDDEEARLLQHWAWVGSPLLEDDDL
jgi:hypothetical protein